MPRIKLFRTTPNDWFVSLGGSEPSRLTHDNSVQALIDNETTLKKIIDAVNSAAHSVYLMQSEYHPYFVAVYDSVTDVPRPKESLAEVLRRKAAKSDVKVYILLNNNLVAPDSFKATSDAFSDTSVREEAETRELMGARPPAESRMQVVDILAVWSRVEAHM